MPITPFRHARAFAAATLAIAPAALAFHTRPAAAQSPSPSHTQSSARSQTATQEQIIAYLFPRSQPINPAQVPATSLTRINYSFANVVHGRAALVDPVDVPNLATLNSLKQHNPNLKILVSIGGWEWSGDFSDAVLTPASRATFIDSIVDMVKQNHLDGIDLDWEYPGVVGATNHFRPVDGANFATFLRELRARFDREQPTGQHWLLSIAAGSSDEYLRNSPVRDYAASLDTVNLMAYDMYEPSSDHLTGNHAPLHTDTADPKAVSAEASVRAFEAAGVPADKLVLGVPFYGHVWHDVPSKNNGLFQPGKAGTNDFAPYSAIAANMLHGHGFTRHWDATAGVPYLYNPTTRIFVTYEDPESLAGKCSFIRSQHLAGVMFWELSNDPSNTLLNVLDKDLRADTPSRLNTLRPPAQSHKAY